MNKQRTAFLEERLGDGLNAIAESEAPVSTVTVAGVITSGRRQLRRRTRTFALYASLVSAAALTVGALALAGPGGTTYTPSTPTGQSGSEASIGNSTDPLTPTIAFGWLPAALNGMYETSQEASGPNWAVDPTALVPPMNGPGDSMVQVWAPGDVILTASVSGPNSGAGPGMSHIAAGTVQGHQAWWETGAPGSATASRGQVLVLEWQYEPNAWARLDYNGQTSAAEGAMVLKVANNLVIGPANPVALPFSLHGLPAGLRFNAADVNLSQQHDAQVGTAAVRLCLTSTCFQTGSVTIWQTANSWGGNSGYQAGNAPMPDLSLQGKSLGAGTPVTVSGYAARLWTNSQGATLIFSYGDAKVTISAAGAEYRALGGVNGFLAFCRSLSWYGANPAHWTTDVIR